MSHVLPQKTQIFRCYTEFISVLRLRGVYLDHLEVWGGEAREEEEREAREKEEEAHGELDLRMHLHTPRKSRISQDIYRVRAGKTPPPPPPPRQLVSTHTGELEAHRDRIGRHARAVVSGIADVKSRAQTASDAMKTEV